MRRNVWISVLFVMSLGLFLGCGETGKERLRREKIEELQGKLKYYDREGVTSPKLSAASETERVLRNFYQEREVLNITLEELGTTSKKLAWLQIRANVVTATARWERFVSQQENDLIYDGAKSQKEQERRFLEKWMKDRGISPEYIGKAHVELLDVVEKHHALQAEIAMLLLYRYPTDIDGWENRTSLGYLLDRLTWELIQANDFKLTEHVFKNGEMSISYAGQLRDMAYTRTLDHLLSQLRLRKWTYPTSSDYVDKYFKVLTDSGLHLSEVGTTEGELEHLRLRGSRFIKRE